MPSEKKTGNCNHMSSQVKHNKSGALVGRKCLEEAPFTWNCIGTEKITSKEEKKERRGRGFVFPGGFPPSLAVKNPPVMQETLVWSLGWEDPLEEGMATHSSILAWRISWTEEPGSLQSTGPQRVEHDWRDLENTHAQVLRQIQK